MSSNPVLNILTRAFIDEPFRRQLLSDLSGTLAQLNIALTPEQLNALKKAIDEGAESFAAGLDKRLSQSGVSLNPQTLMQQRGKFAKREAELLETKTVAGGPHWSEARTSGPRPGPEASEPPPLEETAGHDNDEPDYEVETD